MHRLVAHPAYYLFIHMSISLDSNEMQWQKCKRENEEQLTHLATYCTYWCVRIMFAVLLQSVLAVVMYRRKRWQQWKMYSSAKCSVRVS